jgi:hypothetical protein
VKIFIGFLFGLSLLGCTLNSSKLLTYEQAAARPEAKEGERIAAIDNRLRDYRELLVAAGTLGLIDQAGADTVIPDLRATDYFMCASWRAMVEGDVKTRDEAMAQAEKGIKAIQSKLEQIIHRPGDKT